MSTALGQLFARMQAQERTVPRLLLATQTVRAANAIDVEEGIVHGGRQKLFSSSRFSRRKKHELFFYEQCDSMRPGEPWSIPIVAITLNVGL